MLRSLAELSSSVARRNGWPLDRDRLPTTHKMDNQNTRRTVEGRTIDGIDALVNTDPGEIFIDLPASNPRYIRVQEGDQIQEGDVSDRTTAEMAGPRLTHWVVQSITAATVTGTNTETGETREWDREQLVQRLCVGEFSAELVTFDRLSVSRVDEWPGQHSVDGSDGEQPYVIAVAYGNNGEKFTRLYAATEAGNWDTLEIIQEDRDVQRFDDELRARFDTEMSKALDTERRFH